MMNCGRVEERALAGDNAFLLCSSLSVLHHQPFNNHASKDRNKKSDTTIYTNICVKTAGALTIFPVEVILLK